MLANLKNSLVTSLHVFLLVCVAALNNAAHAQERNPEPGFAACTVELNGDSLLFGYISDPSVGWRLPTSPAQWLRSKGYTVEDRTAAGLSMYDTIRGYSEPRKNAPPQTYPAGAQPAFHLAPHHSNIVVLQAAVNDYPNENIQQLYVDYAWAIDWLRSQNKIPVVTGVTQIDARQNTPEVYAKVAAIRALVRKVAFDKGAHYASYDLVPVAVTDSIHLDQASSNGVTENLRYVLSYICATPF